MRLTTALAVAVALLTVALSGAAVAPARAQASAQTWNELFTLDCSGKLYAMSSSGVAAVATDVSLIRQVFDFYVSTYASRIRCRCPNIQPAELAEYFGWTMQTVLRWAEPKLSVQLPECSTPGTRFVHTNLFPGDTWDFLLPDTCTSAGYPSAGCRFSMPLGSGSGMTVNIAISQCPAASASNLPYISVTCSGLHCADFGRPCASAADCAREPTTGAQTPCGPVTTGSGDYTSVTRLLHDGMVAAGLFGRADSCSTGDGTRVDDGSVGTWAYNQLQSMLSGYLGGAATGSQNTVCGIDWVQNDWPNAFSGICSTQQVNGVTVVDCSTSAWDGTLYDGATNVFDANRMADFGSTLQQNQPQLKRRPWPSDPSGNGVHNVLTFGCDDSFGALMTDPVLQFAASLPPLHAAYTAVMNSVQQLELCRTAGAPLSQDQVDARFNFGSLLPYLVNLTQHPATPFALGAPISDLWSYQYALWSGNSNFMNGVTMNMPAGCQLSDWLSTGTCRFEFTGLSTLVNRDVRLRFQLQKCTAPTSKSLFSAIVDCVGGDGTDCADVMQPYAWDYCEQDSDCSGGRTCNAMAEWVPYPPWVASSLWLTSVNVYKVQLLLKSATDPFKYSRMTYAQQTAVAQALTADLALALNTQFGQPNGCRYGPCVPQQASAFQPQGFYVSNFDNSFNALFTILPGGTMTSYQLMQQLLLMSAVGHGPAARYAYLNDSTQITQGSYSVPWYQCPDGSWQPDQTYCNPQDQCDLQGQAQIDAINLMRVLRGLPQLTHLNPQYAHHGFCAISVQNVSNAYSWWQNQFSETYDAAGHPILSLAGLVAFEMPDPNNPNCYTNCQSAAPRTAAAASAPFVALCAALAAALAWRS